MGRGLTSIYAGIDKTSGFRTQDLPFRIAIAAPMQNGFEIKDMTRDQLRQFHNFLSDTVYNGLTISQTDKLFLRKRGLSKHPPIYDGIELLHYGKDRSKFRVFGYYNQDNYFVLCRIDGGHKTHK